MGILFKSLGELIRSHIWEILISVAVLSVFIFIIRKLSQIHNRKKELRQASSDRTRDENLNSFILNTHASTLNKPVYVPYEVDYSNSAAEANKSKSSANLKPVMVQLVEKTGLSKRKFALNVANGITIGTSNDNDIVFIADGQDSFCCEIRAVGENVFAINRFPSVRVILRRKKNQAIIDENGIRLLTGDELIFGSISYTFSIVK